MCSLCYSFRFRLSYFERPSRRSFSRANSASFKRSKTDRRNPGLVLCSPFCLHKKSQLDVITMQLNVGKRTLLSSLPWQYALSCFPRIEVAFVAFVDALSVEANRAHFLDGCAGFPSYKKKKKKKKKRAISPPEVILPSFKRAISLPEVVLPKKGSLQGNIGQSGPVFRASDWSLP